MNWFNNLKVRTRLLVSFLVIAALTAVVGFVALRNMSIMIERADVMYQRELMGLSHIKQVNVDILHIVRAEKNFILAVTEEQRKVVGDNMVGWQDDLKRDMDKAKPLFHSEHGKDLVARLDKAIDEWLQAVQQVVSTASGEKISEERESVKISMGIARDRTNSTRKAGYS
jgi:methyl-accepting chemotaxis protein